MIGGVEAEAWAVCAVMAGLGAVVQRVTGQGFGTIVSAFVALLAPERIPAAVLILGMAITLASLRGERADIVWGELAPALAGRLVGTLPVVAVLAMLPGPEEIGLIVGLVILLGVGLSLAGWKVAINPATLFLAGGLSGFMGGLTSVGAAPIGLLYQRAEARRMRATLNAFFLIGLVFSVAGVAAAGRLAMADAVFAASLLPTSVLGVWVGTRVARRYDGGGIRTFVLVLVTAAAAILILRWAL